jgi:PEP-CTERM motif
MKKLLSACVLLAVASSAFAQGLVTISETSYNVTTNSATSGKISATANSYYFTILSQSDATGSTTTPTISSAASLLTGWTASGLTGTNGTGLNAGKIIGLPGTSSASTAAGWAPGSTNFFVVVGWSATEGSTWAQVSSEIQNGTWSDTTASGVFGYTVVGYGAANSLTPGFAVFGSNPGQINGTSNPFVLTQVVAAPEPTTIALAGLGGLALLGLRRKK